MTQTSFQLYLPCMANSFLLINKESAQNASCEKNKHKAKQSAQKASQKFNVTRKGNLLQRQIINKTKYNSQEYLFIHIHKKEGCNLTHSLAVTDFCIVHGVRCKDVE